MGVWILLLVVLGVFSYWDIREKQLPTIWLLAGIFLSLVLAVSEGWRTADTDLGSLALNLLQRMLPGTLLTLIALALKGRIGCGDGLVLVIIGNLTGSRYSLTIWLIAVGASFVFSCFLLIGFKKNRDYCFPFIPFYLMGATCVFLTSVIKGY